MKSEEIKGYLEVLELAITKRNVLRLSYRSPASGNRSDREIEPLGLYFTQDQWKFVAFCRLRKEKREFRVDGVVHLEVTIRYFCQTSRKTPTNYNSYGRGRTS